MSLANSIGAGGTVEIGGETLQVTPRILRHYAEIEAEILNRRGNPFDMIRDNRDVFDSNPELLDRFVEKAFDEARKMKEVSLQDVGLYITETWRGQCMAIWLSIRENDPQKWTFDYFLKVFADEFEDRIAKEGEEAANKWMAQIEGTIDRASGEDEMGNSNGSPKSTQQTAEEPSSPETEE